MKKLLTLITIIAIGFTACQKDEETDSNTSSGTTTSTKDFSGLKNGTYTVDGKEIKPIQVLFSGGQLISRFTDSEGIKDCIIEAGNNPLSGIYPLFSKNITADSLRVDYITGTQANPVHWYSESGQVSISVTSSGVNANFKDVVVVSQNDPNKKKTVSANLTGIIQ